MEGDYIEIIGLDVNTRIGVPEEERAVAQKISIDVNLKPSNGLKSLNDKIEQTIDYYLVSEVIKEISGSGQRKLIETLAEDIIKQLKKDFNISEIEVRIKKFIIPETDYVSVVVKD